MQTCGRKIKGIISANLRQEKQGNDQPNLAGCADVFSEIHNLVDIYVSCRKHAVMRGCRETAIEREYTCREESVRGKCKETRIMHLFDVVVLKDPCSGGRGRADFVKAILQWPFVCMYACMYMCVCIFARMCVYI